MHPSDYLLGILLGLEGLLTVLSMKNTYCTYMILVKSGKHDAIRRILRYPQNGQHILSYIYSRLKRTNVRKEHWKVNAQQHDWKYKGCNLREIRLKRYKSRPRSSHGIMFQGSLFRRSFLSPMSFTMLADIVVGRRGTVILKEQRC